MEYLLVLIILVLAFFLYKALNQLNTRKSEIENLKKTFEDLQLKYESEIKQLSQKGYLLENELKIKTKELIIKAREHDEKIHLLDMVKDKIKEAKENPSKSDTRIHEIDLKLDQYNQEEDNTFELQMDEYHQKFIKTLKQKFPDITPLDQRLCLYIKTGLSSSEMAERMHVLPSSIYIIRSRLRKKLSLDAKDDLYGFLQKIGE